MSPRIATVVCALCIAGLFVLDRKKARTSPALWLPVIWLLIIGSRPVSRWLHPGPPIATPDEYLEGSLLDGAVFAILVAVGLIVLASRGRRVGSILRGNGPLLLFLLYCATSILWSDFPGVALKRWIKFIGDGVMALIVLTDTNPSAAVTRLLVRTGFFLVPLSVLLIKYYADLGRVYLPWIWKPEWTGVTTQKNELGMISMIFGLASLWYLLQELRDMEGRRRVGPLIAHGTFLAMVLWLFAKANSVTSLSCFVLAGGLMAVVTSPTPLARRPVTVHLLVATILSVSLLSAFFDTGGLLGALGRNSTLTGRTEIWKLVLSMTTNPLLGAGFESFWLGERLTTVWSAYYGINQSHNGYLEVYLNLGWIGIALLGVVLVTGYRNAIGAFFRDRRIGSLKLAYFVAAVVYNFTEAGFKMTHPMWDIFLLAATAVAAAPLVEGAKFPHRVPVSPGAYHAGLPPTKTRTYEGAV